MNARPRLPKNSGSTLWVQVPEPVCRIGFSSSFKSSEGEVLLWLFWNPRGWYLKQWTISFNSKELAGRQGTKLGWSCGLVPTPSKHSLQARVSNILYVIQHIAAFSLTHCSICASDQRVIHAFKLWPHYILRLLRPGRPSWLDPNLMGSPP